MNKRKCPKCGSFGVAPVRRSSFKKLMGMSNRYHCIDCGRRFSESALQVVDVSPGSQSSANP